MRNRLGIESILAVDVGTYWTHAALIDIVEGEFRLVSKADVPSTLGRPEQDACVGVLRAAEEITAVTERPLFSSIGELLTPEREDGQGVDSMVVTASAADPLTVVVAGLTRDLSVESGLRCANYGCSSVVGVLVLDEMHEASSQDRLRELHDDPPDVVLITGAVDTGPTRPLLEMSRLLAATFSGLVEECRPKFLYAANQDARRPVARAITGRAELRVVENLRPTLDTETISEARRELQKIYQEVKLDGLPGFARLQRWSRSRPYHTVDCFEAMVGFLGTRHELREGVLGVDMGAAATHIVMSDQESLVSEVVHNRGIRRGLRAFAGESDLYDVLRWVPTVVKPGTARARLANMELRPNTLMQDRMGVWLEHAVGRETVWRALKSVQDRLPGVAPSPGLTPSLDVILARGGLLAYAPNAGLAALTLIDAIQPVGACRLVLDWASILPQLGAVARSVPLAATQVLQKDALLDIGTVVAPVGVAKEGQRALRLGVEYEDGSSASYQIAFGTIQRIPLAPGRRAVLTVRPSRQFDIGMGRRGLGGQITVRGGAVGVIVDARGRPLQLPSDQRERLAKVQQWFRAVQS